MNLTKVQLDLIEKMAYMLFSPSLIAINLEVDELEFDECVKTPGTDARKAFYRGFIKQQSELREALIKSAMNGSNPAQQELLKLRDKLIQYE